MKLILKQVLHLNKVKTEKKKKMPEMLHNKLRMMLKIKKHKLHNNSTQKTKVATKTNKVQSLRKFKKLKTTSPPQKPLK